MRLLPVVAGAFVPHAPLLLPELESDEVAAEAAEARTAIGSLEIEGLDAIVVLSPHGSEIGVYDATIGDLGDFGAHQVAGEFRSHPGVVAELGNELVVLERDVDYGVLVPALLAGWPDPVVGVAVGSVGSSIARRLAGSAHAIAVVASVNTSAALSSRAPLTQLPAAREVERDFLKVLQEDVGETANLAGDLARDGGSCAEGPLRVMAELFPGRAAHVLSYRAPVGVGYLVAEVA